MLVSRRLWKEGGFEDGTLSCAFDVTTEQGEPLTVETDIRRAFRDAPFIVKPVMLEWGTDEHEVDVDSSFDVLFVGLSFLLQVRIWPNPKNNLKA